MALTVLKRTTPSTKSLTTKTTVLECEWDYSASDVGLPAIGSTLAGDTSAGIAARLCLGIQYVRNWQQRPTKSKVWLTYRIPAVEEWLMLHLNKAVLYTNGSYLQDRYRTHQGAGGTDGELVEGPKKAGLGTIRYVLTGGDNVRLRGASQFLFHFYTDVAGFTTYVGDFTDFCGYKNSNDFTQLGSIGDPGKLILHSIKQRPVLGPNGTRIFQVDALFVKNLLEQTCTSIQYEQQVVTKALLDAAGNTVYTGGSIPKKGTFLVWKPAGNTVTTDNLDTKDFSVFNSTLTGSWAG